MDEQKVSAIDDLVAPVEYVTLSRLKTKSGEPAIVLVEPVGELELLRLVEAAPGLSPKIGKPKDPDPRELAASALKVSGGLIARSCFLSRPDGSFARPSFWHETEISGCFPVHLLSDIEQLTLFKAAMTVSGFWSPAVESLSFRDGVGAGGEPGVRAVGEREGGDAGLEAARVVNNPLFEPPAAATGAPEAPVDAAASA